MDISVVIPTRNRSALLATTLRSVLRQREVDFEVVVVDEASSDDTPALLANIGDPRVRVVRHEAPRGVGAARNRGVAEARGQWVAFLDDDDLWAPDKLRRQLQALRESGAAWAYAGHVNIDIAHRVTGGAPPLPPGEVMLQLPEHNVVPGGCSGVMVSKAALALSGEFDPQLQPLADWDLWLRLARVGPPAWVSRPLVAYRLHGSQMSLEASRVEAEFRLVAGRNRTGNPAILLRYLGWWALRVKDHRRALRLFVRAWRERRPDYGLPALASDLTALGRDILHHRCGIRSLRLTSRPASEEQRVWRVEAQAWIDELLREDAPPGQHGGAA